MKKTFIFATALALAFSFASCSDDNYDQTNNTVNPSQSATSNALDGAYKSITFDTETGKSYTLNVSGNSVIVSSVDKNGVAEVSTATGSYSEGEKAFSGTFSEASKDLKNIKLTMVGSTYLECTMTKTNGGELVLGFNQNNPALGTSVEDITNQAIQAVAKKGITELLKLVPYGEVFKDVVINQIFPGKATMSVADCYKQLNESLDIIKQRIEEQTAHFDNGRYNDILSAHKNTQELLQAANMDCLASLASIQLEAEENNLDPASPEVKSKVANALSNWQRRVVDGSNTDIKASLFIDNTAIGYGMQKQDWYNIVDAYCENVFPWEHMAYTLREDFRTRDMITCLQCAFLIDMYNTVIGGNVFYSHESLNAIIQKYKDNPVVRDEQHAICQIKGANKVVINHGGFQRVDLSFYDFPSNYSFNVHNDHNWFVVPNWEWHHKKTASRTDYTQDVDAKKMLTVDEAKAIFNYYGGTMTMAEILKNEAGVNRVDDCINSGNDDILFLLGSNVRTKTHWSDHTLYIDNTCFLNRKQSAFDSLAFGDYISTKSGGFSKWESRTDKPIRWVMVNNRTAGWKPMDY